MQGAARHCHNHVTHIPQSCPLGLKWRCVSLERPLPGKSVSNPALESNLPTQVNFTQVEWAAFGTAHLRFDDYIMLKNNDVVHYFQPAASNLNSGPGNQKPRKNTNR